PGKTGPQKADVKHCEAGWFFEVKNIEIGKSKREKSFGRLAERIFSDPKSFGKHFEVEKGRPVVMEGKKVPNGSSIISTVSHAKQYSERLRDARYKFNNDQKAAIVFYNVFNI